MVNSFQEEENPGALVSRWLNGTIRIIVTGRLTGRRHRSASVRISFGAYLITVGWILEALDLAAYRIHLVLGIEYNTAVLETWKIVEEIFPMNEAYYPSHTFMSLNKEKITTKTM